MIVNNSNINSINDWADFWNDKIGVNVIPANSKEKKTLDFDIDIIYPKLLKFLHESKSKGYEAFNVVTDDGDSIYSPPFEELATNEGGGVFISEDKIEDFVNQLIEQRLGPSLNNKNE